MSSSTRKLDIYDSAQKWARVVVRTPVVYRSTSTLGARPLNNSSTSHSLNKLTRDFARSDPVAIWNRNIHNLVVLLLLVLSTLVQAGTAEWAPLQSLNALLPSTTPVQLPAVSSSLLFEDIERPELRRMRLLRRQHASSLSSTSRLFSATGSTSTGPERSTTASQSSTERPSTTSAVPTTTAAATSTEDTSTTIDVADFPVESVFPLPEPFDSALGRNFTSEACPEFFTRFLSDPEFEACLPLSLLIQTSDSFFAASRSLVRVTQTLDAACGVDFNSCNALMGRYARELESNENCGSDLRNRQPVVVEAHNGFLAYESLYHAGCLKDESGSYCFANAISNTTSTADPYPYFIPVGLQLPGGTRPTCSECLRDTMAIFSASAKNSRLPISNTYLSAAQQVNVACGPTFADSSVISSASGPRSEAIGSLRGLAVAVSITFMLITW